MDAGARSNRTRKILIIAGSALLGLLLLAYVLVPVIASGMAPGIIERAFADQFQGSLKVGKVSLGWGAPLTIESIDVLDESGKKVGTLTASAPVGLWGLLGGPRDLRTIKATADLVIVETIDAQGRRSSNLSRALQARTPKAAAPAKPAAVPTGYSVAIELGASQITYTEQQDGRTLGTSSITDLVGTAEFTSTGPATLKAALKGRVNTGDRSAPPAPPGAIELSLTVLDFSDAAGVMTPDAAKVSLKLTADRAPVRMLDSALGLGGALAGGLGDTADATITAEGTTRSSTAGLVISSPNTSADLSLAVNAGRVSALKPGWIRLRSTAFIADLPAVRAGLQRGGIALEQAPNLELTVTSLAASTDAGADLRGASMDVTLKTGAATITVPGDAPGSARRTIALSPLESRLRTADLAQGLDVTGAASATLDGRSAGSFELAMRLTGLLDAQGRPVQGLPASVAGTLAAKGVSADVLAPFLAALDTPLDARADLGPTLDASLTARPAPGVPDATDIDVSVESANVRLQSAWRMTPALLETRERGLSVSIDATTPLARRVLARAGEPPLTIDGAGPMRITSTRLSMPLKDGRPSGEPPQGDLAFQYGGTTVTPRRGAGGGPGEPLGVEALTANVTIAPGQPLRAVLDGRLSSRGRALRSTGDLTVDGLGTPPAGRAKLAGLGAARVSGRVDLTEVPTALVAALGAGNADLIAGVAGERVNVGLGLTGADATQSVALTIGSAVLTAEAGAELGTSLRLAAARADSTMTAESARSLLLAFGADETSLRDLRLPATSRVSVRVEPVDAPLLAGTLEVDGAAVGDRAIKASIDIDQPLTVENLRVGQSTISGGLSNVAGSGAVPLAALVKGGPRKPITGLLTGLVVRRSPAGQLDEVATLRAEASLTPDGPMSADVSVKDLRSALADELLGRPGYVSGALGENATLTFKARRDNGQGATSVLLDLDSRLLTARNWKFEASGGAARILGPAVARWQIEPAWANQYLLARPGNTDPTAVITLVGATLIDVEIERLVVSLADSASGVTGPLKPGLFDVAAKVLIPRAAISWQEETRPDEGPRGGFDPGRAVQNIVGALGNRKAPTNLVQRSAVLQNAGVSLAAKPDGSVQALARIANVRSDLSDLEGKVEADFVVQNLADAGGSPTGAPVITGSSEIQSFPTAVLDGLARQRGVLRDGLGPSMDFTARFNGFSRNSGTLSAAMDSPRAIVNLSGTGAGGTLALGGAPVASGPGGSTPGLKVQIVEISQSLGERLFKRIVSVSSVYKTRQDGPGSVTSSDLVVPLDGDMAKFHGTLRVDIGTARFTVSSSAVKQLLKGFNQKVDGVVGQRMAPFDVVINRGVATFNDVKVPLGEFVCETSGTIDLVRDSSEVVLWIPFTQVSDEFTGKVLGGIDLGIGGLLNRGLPQELQRELLVPFRVRQSGDGDMRYDVAPDLFAKRFGGKVRDFFLKTPGKVIDSLPIPNPFKKK